METEEDRVDSNDDEEINIYGDLCDFDLGEEIEKLKNEITNKDEQIVTLKSDIDKLNDSIEELKKNESNLKRNISALYQTAKAEIERKNRMIEDLRKQLESSRICKFNPNFGHKRKIRESSPDANTAKRFKCDIIEIDSDKEEFCRNNEAIDCDKEEPEFDKRGEYRSKRTDNKYRGRDENRRFESRRNDVQDGKKDHELRNRVIDCDESKFNDRSTFRSKSRDNRYRRRDDSSRYEYRKSDVIDRESKHEPENDDKDVDQKSKFDDRSHLKSKNINNKSRRRDDGRKNESRRNIVINGENKHESRSNDIDSEEKAKVDIKSESRSKSTDSSSRKIDDNKRNESRKNNAIDEGNKREPRNNDVDCDEKSKIDVESESRSKSTDNSSRKKDGSKRYESRTNDTVDEDNKHEPRNNVNCDEKSKIDDKSESRSKSTDYRQEKKDVEGENKHESINNDVDCDQNSKLDDKSDSRSKSTSNRYKRDDNSRYESRKNDVDGENKHEPRNSDVDCDQKSKFVEESELRLKTNDNRYRRRYDSSVPNSRRNDIIGNERESSFDSSRYRIGNRRRNNENRYEPRSNSNEYDKHESYSDDNRESRSNYNNRYRIRNRSPFRFSDRFRYRNNYKFESETNRYCDRIGSQEDDGYFSRSIHPDERYNDKMSRRIGRDEICGDTENRMFRSRSKDSSDNFRNDDREFSERSNFRRSDDRSPAPEQHMQQTTSFHPFVTERNDNTRRSITPMPDPEDIEEPKPKPPKKRLKMLIEVEKKYKRNKLNSNLNLSSEIDSSIKKTKEVIKISGDDKKSAPHSKKVREESVAENEKNSVNSTIDRSDAKRGCASSETKNSKRKDTNSLSKLSDLSVEITKSIPEKIIKENLQNETLTKEQHLKQTENIKLSTTDSGKESSSTSTQKKSEEIILEQQKPKQFEEDMSKDNKKTSKKNVSESSDKSSEEIDKKNQRKYEETNIFLETLDFEMENSTDNSKKLIITEKNKCDSTKEKEENANEGKNCSYSRIEEKGNERSIRQMSKEKNSVRSESNKEDRKDNKEADKEEQYTGKKTQIDENESKSEDINRDEKCIDTKTKLNRQKDEKCDEKLDKKEDRNFKEQDQNYINKQKGEDIGSKDNLTEQQQNNKDIKESDRSKKQKSVSITDTTKIITNDKDKDTKSKQIPLEKEAYVSKKVDDVNINKPFKVKEDTSTNILKNSEELDKETKLIASQSTSILNKLNKNKSNEKEKCVKEKKKDETSTNKSVEKSVPEIESNAETIYDIQRYIHANNNIKKDQDVSKKNKEESSDNPQEKMHSKKEYKKDDKNESRDIKALDNKSGKKKGITENVADHVDSSNKGIKQDEKRRDIKSGSESTTNSDGKETTEHVAIQKHMNTTKDKVAKGEDVNKKTKVINISQDTRQKDCPKKEDKTDSGKLLEQPKQNITEKIYIADNKFEEKQNKHIIEKPIAEQYNEMDGRPKSSIKRRRVSFLDVLEADFQENKEKIKDSVKSKRGNSKEKNISVEEKKELLEDNKKDGIVNQAEEKDEISTNKLVQELNKGTNTKNREVPVSETNKNQVTKGMQENVNKKNEDMDKLGRKESKKSCVPQTKEVITVQKITDNKPRNKKYSKYSNKEGCSGDKKNEKVEVKVSDNKKLNPREDFTVVENITESGTNKGKKDEKVAKQSVEKEKTSTNDADKKGDCPKATKDVLKKLEIDRPNKEQINITVQKNNDKNENEQKQSSVEKHKQQKREEEKVEYVTSPADKISNDEHTVKPGEKNLKPKRRKSTFIEQSNIIEQNKKPENAKSKMGDIEQSVTQMTISSKPNKNVPVHEKVTQENIKTSPKEGIKTGIEKQDLEKQSDKMKENKQSEVYGKSETLKVGTVRTLSATRRCINKIKRRITFYATDDLKVMNQNKCTEVDSKNTEEKTTLTENAQHNKTTESKQTDLKVSEKVDKEKCHVQKPSIQNQSNKCTEFDSKNIEQNTENAQHNKTSKRKQTDSKVSEKADKEKCRIQKSSIEEQNQGNKCTEFDNKDTEQNTENAQHNKTSKRKQSDSKVSEKADKEKCRIQKSSIEEQNQSNKCTEFDSKNTELNTILTKNVQHNRSSESKQSTSKLSEKADKEKDHIQKSSIEAQNQSNKCTEFDRKNTEQNTILTKNAQRNRTSESKQTTSKLSEKADKEKGHVQKSSIEEENESNKCTEFDSKYTEEKISLTDVQHNKTFESKQTASKMSEKDDKEEDLVQKSFIEEQNDSNLSLFNNSSNTSSTSSTCSTSSSSSSSSSSTSSDTQEESSDISLNSSKPEEKLIEINNVEQEQTHSESSLSLSESSTSEETVVMGKLEHMKKIDKKYDSIIKQCLHTIDVETKAADVKSNSDDNIAKIDNKNVTAKMTQSKVKVLEIVTISEAISKNAVEDGIKITSNTDESLTNMSSSSRSASQNISPNSRRTATKRRITPIPVKDEKPVSSFENILTKTCQPKTFNASTSIDRNLHLTHEGEIPVLHLEENQINDLPTEMHINDRNIISLLDSMNISNIDLDIPKFKNSSSESAVNSEGKEGGSSDGNLTFKNIMDKVTTSTPMVSAKSEQVESGVSPSKRQKTESDVSGLQISKNASDLSIISNLSTDKVVGSNVQSNATTTVQRRRRRCRLVIRD